MLPIDRSASGSELTGDAPSAEDGRSTTRAPGQLTLEQTQPRFQLVDALAVRERERDTRKRKIESRFVRRHR
jgi:hypothetical protein